MKSKGNESTMDTNTSTVTLPEPGTKVIIKDVPGLFTYNNKVATVIAHDLNGYSAGDGKVRLYVHLPTETGSDETLTLYCVAWEPWNEGDPIPEQTPEQVEIVRLTTEATRLRERLLQSQRDHVADLRVIATAAKDEAEERDWCSDYDNAVDEVRRHLTSTGRSVLDEYAYRKRTYKVTIGGKLTLEFSQTVSVEARNEDEARELATEEFEFDSSDANVESLDYAEVDTYSLSVEDVEEE